MSLLRSLLLAFFLIATPFSASSAETQTLRVMSFNVRLPAQSDGPDYWELRREQVVRMLHEQDADVIGTQELFAEQGEYLAAQMPEYAWFGRGREDNGGGEHMGVFYRRDRLRVIESGDFWLSDTPEIPGSITWGHPHPRMVTWALFETLADGRRFYLLNTHLPYRGEDEDARLRGSQAIARRLRTLPDDVPVVLTGDFNTTPNSPAYAEFKGILHDAWTAAAQRKGPEGTFHGFTGQPQKRIDWILVRGLEVARMRVVDSQENGRYPSDHFPLVVELSWPVAAGRLGKNSAVERARR
ncbi:endonuclease/exonuclease/phosphatase family protein [Pseudoxanthomonas sp. UTMC 1351]|uniref:endonuclease/exonuclease/phosphatase family protein n=1 Tax=Pseudoxanthomonas sp. UTMC 1351 TaxID=2695853 RepID=UPI0034CE3D7B